MVFLIDLCSYKGRWWLPRSDGVEGVMFLSAHISLFNRSLHSTHQKEEMIDLGRQLILSQRINRGMIIQVFKIHCSDSRYKYQNIKVYPCNYPIITSLSFVNYLLVCMFLSFFRCFRDDNLLGFPGWSDFILYWNPRKFIFYF